MRDFSDEKMAEKRENFLFLVVVVGRARVLSQIYPIWRKRVLTISPSLVHCRFPQISHPALTRDSAETPLTHPEAVKNHGQGSFSLTLSSTFTSSSKSQTDGMEIIEEKPNEPHNPPMETEEIVSVLDREFLVGYLPLYPLAIAHLPPYVTEEAFAAKHMPDLGYDVKEFQVSHWKLQGWKKLEKKLTSPEFDCGGHKWCVLPHHRSFVLLRNLRTHSGGSFSSRLEIPTLLPMIPSLYISITPTPRA